MGTHCKGWFCLGRLALLQKRFSYSRRKMQKKQLWPFKWEVTSASVTTLFLNNRSRSSSLEHLTVALRDNRKSFLWQWSQLHPAKSRIHDVISGSGVILKVSLRDCAALNLVSLLLKSTCWFLGFLLCISFMLTQTASHRNRAHNFQKFQKIILVLSDSFTLVCTSLIFLTQQKLRSAVEPSPSCAILQCREGLCVSFYLRKKNIKNYYLLSYLINELCPVLPSLFRQLHRKGYNSRIKISVFRVSNSSRSLVILSWDREARISLSWWARDLVLLRRGMNLAAQDTLFPLCTTLFTKLKQPLCRNGRTSPDQTWAEIFPQPGLWQLPAADLQHKNFVLLCVRCCCPLLAVSKGKTRVPIKGKAAAVDAGSCSWILWAELMWWAWDAPIAKKSHPGINLWASGCFLWLELPQHTLEWAPTSVFTSNFSDFSGPTSASAAQMGNEIFPGCRAGKLIYLPISCFTS